MEVAMRRLFLILLLSVATSGAVHAHRGGGAGRPADSAPRETTATPRQLAARLLFSDRQLVTQHDERVEFYSDVLRDGTVLINFIFTQCTDACPTQTARLAEVQSLLADVIGRGVSLVSISVDPEHDRCTSSTSAGARTRSPRSRRSAAALFQRSTKD